MEELRTVYEASINDYAELEARYNSALKEIVVKLLGERSSHCRMQRASARYMLKTHKVTTVIGSTVPV